MVLSVVHVNASEFNHLFGKGELVGYHPPVRIAAQPPTAHLRACAADTLAVPPRVELFSDPASAAHIELVDIVHRLAVAPHPHGASKIKDRSAKVRPRPAGRGVALRQLEDRIRGTTAERHDLDLGRALRHLAPAQDLQSPQRSAGARRHHPEQPIGTG